MSDAEKRAQLRKYRSIANGLLVIAAVIFLTCSWYQSTGNAGAWAGYVRAAAEAGMVGGLADWFAVTALFKHPLGLPIPHTALLPENKSRLGSTMSEFVGENFLNPELITEKIATAGIPERMGNWLENNPETVSREAGSFVVKVVQDIDPDEATQFIDDQGIARFAEPQWGPYAGQMLQGLIDDGKTEPVVDSIIGWGRKKIDLSQEQIATIVDERMPDWAPQFAKSLVGERVYKELRQFAAEVDSNPYHEARQALRRFFSQLAVDLQYDDKTIEKVESLKSDIMNSKVVLGAGATIWASVSTTIIEAASNEESSLRTKIRDGAQEWGMRIQNDESVRGDLDRRITRAGRFLAENYSGEIAAIIEETVDKWDTEEAVDKIQLMVGKDLQFIRYNGTIVGSLAGLAIYVINQLIFGA